MQQGIDVLGGQYPLRPAQQRVLICARDAFLHGFAWGPKFAVDLPQQNSGFALEPSLLSTPLQAQLFALLDVSFDKAVCMIGSPEECGCNRAHAVGSSTCRVPWT